MLKNQIKYIQNLFYDLLNDYGQVYVAVRYSENSAVGNRGFTEEEKKKGLVLVFNRRNHNNLVWNEDGSITATLGFGVGNRSEKCFLHYDDIVSVFSPDARIKLDRWDIWSAKDQTQTAEISGVPEAGESTDKKIVSLDSFRKTKN